MNYRGYPERDLVSNRSSLLLYGSTEAERRAWAEEAAANFEAEGPLETITTEAELRAALPRPRGVLYVPDVSALGDAAQAELVLVLRLQDERPKVIVGLAGNPDSAREQGRLRADLQYALQMAQVNLDEPALRDAIRARRARAPRRPAPKAPAPRRTGSARITVTQAARKVVSKVRKPASAKSAKPAKKRKPAGRRR